MHRSNNKTWVGLPKNSWAGIRLQIMFPQCVKMCEEKCSSHRGDGISLGIIFARRYLLFTQTNIYHYHVWFLSFYLLCDFPPGHPVCTRAPSQLSSTSLLELKMTVTTQVRTYIHMYVRKQDPPGRWAWGDWAAHSPYSPHAAHSSQCWAINALEQNSTALKWRAAVTRCSLLPRSSASERPLSSETSWV